MAEQIERRYSVKLQDFIPFAGSFIYESRNRREARVERRRPKPYNEYFAVGVGLTALNITTGLASMYVVLQGLEALIFK